MIYVQDYKPAGQIKYKEPVKIYRDIVYQNLHKLFIIQLVALISTFFNEKKICNVFIGMFLLRLVIDMTI